MKTTITITLDQAEVIAAVDQYLQRKKMLITGEPSIAGMVDKTSGPVKELSIQCQVEPKKRKERKE